MKLREVFTAVYFIDCAFIWCLTIDAAGCEIVNRKAEKNLKKSEAACQETHPTSRFALKINALCTKTQSA